VCRWWLAALALVVFAGCRARSGPDLAPPPGTPPWESRFRIAFDDGFTRQPITLTGRAPHDVLDQRLFAARLGHGHIVALVQVRQVWGRGRYRGQQDQYVEIEIERVLLGELPRRASDEQVLRVLGVHELPSDMRGKPMLLMLRWAPGESPPYHHHLMPAGKELVEAIEAMVAHAQAEGAIDRRGRARSGTPRKRRRR
jgi:hypothetical protein